MGTQWKPRQVRIRGILTVSYWDEEEHRWNIALIDDHDREYIITAGDMDHALRSHLGEELTIWGSIFHRNGKTLIQVSKYEADYDNWLDASSFDVPHLDEDAEWGWDFDEERTDSWQELGFGARNP